MQNVTGTSGEVTDTSPAGVVVMIAEAFYADGYTAAQLRAESSSPLFAAVAAALELLEGEK